MKRRLPIALFLVVILTFPVRVYACVDINTASPAQLTAIIHIGPQRATAIVEARQRRPFSEVRELTRVSGIATARIRDILAQGVACVR